MSVTFGVSIYILSNLKMNYIFKMFVVYNLRCIQKKTPMKNYSFAFQMQIIAQRRSFRLLLQDFFMWFFESHKVKHVIDKGGLDINIKQLCSIAEFLIVC